MLLGLEVIWFRFLRLYVASTSIAFSMMLAVVLAGIGLGSIVSSLIPDRVVRRRQLLPVFLLLAANATLLSYLFVPGHVLAPNLPEFDRAFSQQVGLLSLALMFPVAFLSGALLPTIVACVQSEVTGWMNSTGLATLFNTIGAAFGPLLAGFVLLPRLGFQSSLIFLRSRLRRTGCPDESKTGMVSATALWSRHGFAQRSPCPDPIVLSLPSR